MRFLCFFLCGLCSLLFTQMASAYTCRASLNTTFVIPSNITISPNDGHTAGSKVGPAFTSSPALYQCDTSGVGRFDSYDTGITASGAYVMTAPSGERIYKTTMPGLGYSLTGATTNCGTSGAINGTNLLLGDINSRKLCSNISSSTIVTYPTNIATLVTVQFYKTSNEPLSGSVIANNLGSVDFVLNGGTTKLVPNITIVSDVFTITTPTCTINNSPIEVDMGKLYVNEFNGPGTAVTRKRKEFAISLTCPFTSDVSISFIGGNVYDSAKGLLTNTGTAKGVLTQILYNNQPVLLGTSFNAGKVNPGINSIPLQVQYYQQGSVTPGSVKSSIDFILTYK